jgi:hypothetical protein
MASDQDHLAVTVGSGDGLVLTIAWACFQQMACATRTPAYQRLRDRQRQLGTPLLGVRWPRRRSR